MRNFEHLTDTERLDAALSNSRRLRRDARHFCERARQDIKRGRDTLMDLAVLAEALSKSPQKTDPRRH